MSATRDQRKFNPQSGAQAVSGWKGLHGEANTSWWIGRDRAALAAQVKQELPRMARSSIAHALKPEAKDHAGW